jgi:hypothetical protein
MRTLSAQMEDTSASRMDDVDVRSMAGSMFSRAGSSKSTMSYVSTSTIGGGRVRRKKSSKSMAREPEKPVFSADHVSTLVQLQ